MKIIINTASTHKGGGVQVALSFINECRKYTEHEYHVILGNMLAELIDEAEYPPNFSFYRIGYRPATRVFSLKKTDRFFKKIEEKEKPDVVFTSTGPAYWRPKAPHVAGFNLPHYLYKESPFFKHITFSKRLKWNLKGKAIQYYFKRDVDALVVQTDDVNKRVRKFLNMDKVFTVTNNYSHYYDLQESFSKKMPPRQPSQFRLLSLSAWHSHKNLGIIRDIIDLMTVEDKARIRFVLTLPDETYMKEFPAEYRSFVFNIGSVPPKEGPGLYSECDAVFLPTLLECFTASYAEAMVMGKPIITSDLGFAHTVCGDAALYAEPVDALDYYKRIKLLMNNDDLRKNLVEKGRQQVKTFDSAEERARKYLDICKKLADERKD